MKFFPIALLIFQVASSNACVNEASTFIQIKNYEGPIYLTSPQKPCEEKILHHQTPKKGCDFDCNCVSTPASSCIPVNTASQSTTGLYNVPHSLYQDTCVNTQCPGLYNVPYPLYQDGQYCPVVPVTTSVYCTVPQTDCSYTCGKCGKKIC